MKGILGEMNVSRKYIGVACLLAGVASTSVEAADLKFVNYSETGILGAVVPINGDDVYPALGANPGTPVSVMTNEGVSLPASFDPESGKLLVLLSMGPREVMEATATTTNEAPMPLLDAKWDGSSSSGMITNGLVAARTSDSGVVFELLDPLTGDSKTVAENVALRGWVDSESQGQLKPGEARARNLTRIDLPGATIVEARAAADESKAQLVLRKAIDEGHLKGVTIQETMTVYPGRQALDYLVTITNESGEERYLANVQNGESVIHGDYGELIQWGRHPLTLYRESLDPRLPPVMVLSTDGQMSSHLKPSQGWGRKTAYVEKTGGYGLGTALTRKQRFDHQWHRWAIGLQSFGIATSTEHSPLPALLPAGSPVEIGALLTVSVPGGNGFEDLQSDYDSVIEGVRPGFPSPPVAVYVDGEVVAAPKTVVLDAVAGTPHGWNVTEGRMEMGPSDLTLIGDGAGGQMSLSAQLDFDRDPLLYMKLDRLRGQVTVMARPVGGDAGDETLLETSGPIDTAIELADLLEDTGTRDFVFTIGLDGERATLNEFRITPRPLPPVTLAAPDDGARMSSVASSFDFEPLPEVPSYEIQIARDQVFTQPFYQGPTRLPRFTRMTIDSHYLDEQLQPGDWYWRVRGASHDGIPGEWSKTRHVVVEGERVRQPPIRSISPDAPLFVFDAFKVTDMNKFEGVIPDDLKPFSAFANSGLNGTFEMEQAVSTAEEIGSYQFISMWEPLCQIDRTFHRYPNAIGVWMGEQLGDVERFKRLVRLCAQHGRYILFHNGNFHGGSGWETLFGDPEMAAFIRDHRDYILFGHKTNIAQDAWPSMDIVRGAWLDGTLSHLMMHYEAFYWDHAGFKTKLDEFWGNRGGFFWMMPPNFWNQQSILGISQGASVLSLGGQWSTTLAEYDPEDPSVWWGGETSLGREGPDYHSAFWDMEGRVTPVWREKIVPFLRAVVKHRMIPSRVEVLEATNLAVRIDPDAKDIDQPLGKFADLYQATYNTGPDGYIYELIPNTGRYYWIPLLTEVARGLAGVPEVKLSGLGDVEEIRDRFDQSYLKQYEGEAWVNYVAGRFYVMTHGENSSDVLGYDLPLGNGPIKSIAGKVGPHHYVMGRVSTQGDALWLQSNSNYPEDDAPFRFECASEPSVTVTPREALKETSWDDGVLSLLLSHEHGAVDVEIGIP